MIEARYTLTLDDYREANGVVVDPAKHRATRWRAAGGGVALLLLVAVIVLLNVLTPSSRAGSAGVEPFPLGRLALTMAPALALCLLFAAILFRTARNPPLKPWIVPPAQAKKPALALGAGGGWIAFAAMAVMLFLLLRASSISRQPAATPRPPETRLPWLFDFALPLVPILFLLLVFGIFATWSTKRRLQTMWSAMRHEQRPRTLRAEEASVTVEQADMTSRYHWSFFAGYKETSNLLILYLSPYSFHIVPKRFDTPAALDAFKGLLMNGVPEGTFFPTEGRAAFPVVPMAKVATLSAESG